jgi:hypothetical protein
MKWWKSQVGDCFREAELNGGITLLQRCAYVVT